MANPQGNRAVAYIRVSAVMGREELISPELQRHAIQQYARQHGLELVAEVQDIDRSGRSFTKRRVAEVIDRIKAGEFQTVILWKWSRWGRILRESLIHLAAVEAAGGIVRAATEDFDPSTSTGRFTRNQLLLIAELQSEQIGDSWRATHQKRRRDGLPHMTHPRFGYRYLREERRYVPVPEEAEILRHAYERIVAGVPIRSVARELNARGIRTTKGELWSPTSLSRMLDTGFAAGLIRGRSIPKPGHVQLKDFDIWLPGAHEAVISRDLWEAYRQRRFANADLPPRLRVASRALSGLVYCGLCEDAGRPRRMASTFSGRWNRHAWTCCLVRDTKAHRPVNMNDELVMAAVWDWINREIEDREAAEVTRAAQRKARAKKVAVDVQRHEAHLAQLTKRRRNLTRQLADADTGVDQDDVKALLAETAIEIAKVTALLDAAKAELAGERDALIDVFRGLREEWGEFEPHERREILSKVIDKVLVYPGPKPHTRARAVVMPRWGME